MKHAKDYGPNGNAQCYAVAKRINEICKASTTQDDAMQAIRSEFPWDLKDVVSNFTSFKNIGDNHVR